MTAAFRRKAWEWFFLRHTARFYMRRMDSSPIRVNGWK
jgi:hypothetical protein